MSKYEASPQAEPGAETKNTPTIHVEQPSKDSLGFNFLSLKSSEPPNVNAQLFPGGADGKKWEKDLFACFSEACMLILTVSQVFSRRK